MALEHLVCTELDDAPKPDRVWLTFDQSITEAVRCVTNTAVEVVNLVQKVNLAPQWLPCAYQYDGLTFTREIELFAGPERILTASSFVNPNGDIRNHLQALGSSPLANLLFQSGSSQGHARTYVSTNGWYGRLVDWRVANCSDPLLLLELFDPQFTHAYPIPPT